MGLSYYERMYPPVLHGACHAASTDTRAQYLACDAGKRTLLLEKDSPATINQLHQVAPSKFSSRARRGAYSRHPFAFMSSKMAPKVARPSGSPPQQALAISTMSAGASTWNEGLIPINTALRMSRGRILFAQGSSPESTSQTTIPKL